MIHTLACEEMAQKIAKKKKNIIPNNYELQEKIYLKHQVKQQKM